jgi:hypothetical protein
MKFTGLILICAASALALLLPALGMVKFRMVETGPAVTASVDPSLPPGRPVAVPSSHVPNQLAPAPIQPEAALNSTAPHQGPPALLGPPWTTQKLSLNAWLMLGPVLLLGLGLWTFGPNRGGSGR